MNPFTAQKLTQYGIGFVKKNKGVKELSGNSALAGFIEAWGHFAAPDDIGDFIADIDKAMSGQFHLVEDPDYSIHTYTADLTPQGLKLYKYNSNDHIIGNDTFPLEDIRILLAAWMDFLVNG